jgi:PAS domain S-box-containing protein
MATKRRNALSWLVLAIPLIIVAATMRYAYEHRTQGAAAARREQRLLEMLNAEEHALVIIDDVGVIMDWGKGAEKLFGWTDAEVEGSTLDFLMDSAQSKAHRDAIARRKLTTIKDIVPVECWAYTKAGKLIPIRAVVASFSNHKGYWHMALLSSPTNVRELGTFPRPATERAPPPPNPISKK